MLGDLERAKIVVTNYHAFKLRDTLNLSKGGRSLLQGRGPDLQSIETEGQMLQRVMPGLMGMRSILAFNDEAHHCYREKPERDDEGDARGRRSQGSQEEPRSRKALDLRPRDRPAESGPSPRYRPVGHTLLPTAAPAMPRGRSSPGR